MDWLKNNAISLLWMVVVLWAAIIIGSAIVESKKTDDKVENDYANLMKEGGEWVFGKVYAKVILVLAAFIAFLYIVEAYFDQKFYSGISIGWSC